MTDEEFVQAVLSNFEEVNGLQSYVTEMRKEVDLLRIGLFMLCKMNGHDPEELLKVSKDIFEGKHG